MKFSLWILPGIAALFVGTWTCLQNHTVYSLESDTARLTMLIRQVRAAAVGQPKNFQTKNTTFHKGQSKQIDWKSLMTRIFPVRNNNPISQERAFMEAHRLIKEMSAKKLSAQLDEIDGLDLDEKQRRQLEGMVINALSDKEPKMVLDRYADQVGSDESRMRSKLSVAFDHWAENDPASAVAWYDEQLRQGKFVSKSLDGKSETRMRFETTVVSTLLQSNLQAASAHVAALPDEQRVELLDSFSFTGSIKPGSEEAYIKLARGNLPTESVANALASMAAGLVDQGGYDRIDDFISKSQATDEEKKEIVSRVMENQMSVTTNDQINQDTLDKARAWAATQAPGCVDDTTGRILANSINSDDDFEKTSTLVLQY